MEHTQEQGLTTLYKLTPDMRKPNETLLFPTLVALKEYVERKQCWSYGVATLMHPGVDGAFVADWECRELTALFE